MAIQRLQLTNPMRYRGIESLAPQEMAEFALELLRRLDENQDAIYNDLVKQVVTDPSILPTLTSGSSTASSANSATTDDIDGVFMESVMWTG